MGDGAGTETVPAWKQGPSGGGKETLRGQKGRFCATGIDDLPERFPDADGVDAEGATGLVRIVV